MEIRTVRTEGLGDSTYIIAHDGMGIVVDPQRDIDRFVPVAEQLGCEVRWVLETHLHNDYISGARDLANTVDAELVLPAGAAPVYRHRPAFHHEELTHNSLAIRPIHTPGHTPEHVSYLILVDGRGVALFSGGSLLVGSAGRSDLLGPDRAETLARLQYQSLNRLSRLDPGTGLYPTHGAGSFCTAAVAGRDHSTIGDEVRTNPALRHEDENSFLDAHLSGLAPFPSYYQHMGPANVQGQPSPDLSPPPHLDQEHFETLTDAVVVDIRPQRDFAAGHLPDSLGVELRNNFGVWVGWVAPFNAQLVLVANADQDIEEAVRQLVRIGFDRVKGVIIGLADWDVELATHQVVDPETARSLLSDGTQILDVRAPAESAAGTAAGATTCYLPDLVAGPPDGLDLSRPVLIACETGYRASIAASVLQAQGFEPLVLAEGGIPQLLQTG